MNELKEFENTKYCQLNFYFREHRYRKKGLAIVPTKFGIAFTALFLNQGGALVHVYTDGSVLLSHGGTEMGQGLHTKMIQVYYFLKQYELTKKYSNTNLLNADS